MVAERSWMLSEIASITRGRLIGADTRVVGVSTDSRSQPTGAVFFALTGPTFDGHEYVDSALAAGASGVVVASGRVDLEPRVEVGDPLEALRALAVDARSHMSQPVIAVTGSTGKTSTKDLLASALPGAHASARSFNNEIGVPLTVLAANPDASVLVLEVGSRGAGHIEHLAPV
ncbi:MAG: UDP-N-acetylmuramoyl-tripeptide--D-alanyl-D-alanine ligase, partial [Acidimicrobiia bacterium]|nr:UDP-N-acetylmuramoyl-tripeptide--D-alanyl-D-alanine ligase [Acidimicrobiia bacterium]